MCARTATRLRIRPCMYICTVVRSLESRTVPLPCSALLCFQNLGGAPTRRLVGLSASAHRPAESRPARACAPATSIPITLDRVRVIVHTYTCFFGPLIILGIMSTAPPAYNVTPAPFPAPGKTSTVTIASHPTTASTLYFADKIVITVTQNGRLAHWVRIPIQCLSLFYTNPTLLLDSRPSRPLSHRFHPHAPALLRPFHLRRPSLRLTSAPPPDRNNHSRWYQR